MQAFKKGKLVSPEFMAELENRSKKLVSDLEASTKDLHRPGAGSSSQTTAVNERKD